MNDAFTPAADAGEAVCVLLTPRLGGDLETPIRVPGDKSIAHRAALFAGLATGSSQLLGFPGGRDNQATLDLVEALGAHVHLTFSEHLDEIEAVRIDGFGNRPVPARDPLLIDCLNSGTTSRIGMGVLAGLGVDAVLTGDPYLRKRPMRRVVKPLLALGARIEPLGDGDGDHLPLRVRPGAIVGGQHVELELASAQVKSAILLAALTAGVDVVVREPTPSRDHTERFLQYLGYLPDWRPGGVEVRLPGGGLRHGPLVLTIPGDPSSAAFWAGLAVAAGRSVRICDVCWNPTRTGFYDALVRMGASVDCGEPRPGPEPVVDVSVSGALVRGTEVRGAEVVRAIDELPLLALMGMFLPRGEAVTIRDATELRVKETDRIAAVAEVVAAFGGRAEVVPDGITVYGGMGGGEALVDIDSYGDHRIAMGAAVVAVAAGRRALVRRAGAVAVSYPQFWRELAARGLATVDEQRGDV